MVKIVRTSTVPSSLNNFCKGLLTRLQHNEGFNVVAVSSPGIELDELRIREGVATINVPMQRRISPFKDLSSLIKLIIVFRKERPTIVHSITPKAGLLSMIAAWVCKVPIRIHTFTGLVFPTSSGLKRKVLELTDWLTCACATHVIPEGEGVKRDLLNYHITKKNLQVLGFGNIRGIDLSLFDRTLPDVQAEASKIKEDGIFTFIFIGRLVRDKGINELVKAFSRLNKEHKNTRLILVGQQEIEDPIHPQTLKEIGHNKAIKVVGRRPDVRPWLAASDVFVLPSYREGFPNSVIEAGAMGLASIVTNVNGANEIIVAGKNGIIVQPKDCQGLFDAMEYLIDHPSNKLNMEKNARPMVADRYEKDFVQQCMIDFYRDVLSQKANMR